MKACSLLIPCHNSAPYLEATWHSLEPLVEQFAEVICLDDASSDETASILSKLPVRHIRSAEHLGVGAARNRLAREASAPWLCFLDADDRLLPAFASALLAGTEEKADVVTGDVDWIDSESGTLQIARRYSAKALHERPIVQAIENPIGVIGAVIRTQAFWQTGGFREDISCWEDSDLFVRLAVAGCRFRAAETVVACSLRHASGISRNQRYCMHCRLQLLDEYCEESPADARPVIAAEAEKVAWQCLFYEDNESLTKAIGVAKKCGVVLPSTNSILLQTVRAIFSTERAMKLQYALRMRLRKRNRSR